MVCEGKRPVAVLALPTLENGGGSEYFTLHLGFSSTNFKDPLFFLSATAVADPRFSREEKKKQKSFDNSWENFKGPPTVIRMYSVCVVRMCTTCAYSVHE